MTTKRERALSTPGHAYSYINGLSHEIDNLQYELASFLWDCHEDEDLWESMTYEKLGIALRCSRQAAQQRVHRLLDVGLAQAEALAQAEFDVELPFDD